MSRLERIFSAGILQLTAARETYEYSRLILAADNKRRLALGSSHAKLGALHELLAQQRLHPLHRRGQRADGALPKIDTSHCLIHLQSARLSGWRIDLSPVI